MKPLIMDDNTFNAVAELCKWSSKNISVVRELLVNQKTLVEAVQIYPMSIQQASVLRSRFIKRYEKFALENFMQKQKPKNNILCLGINYHKNNIKTLISFGYTMEQIDEYLQEHGLEITKDELNLILEGHSK